MSWTQSAWHWQCSNITLKEHMEGHAYLTVYIHHKTINHWAIDCVTINKHVRSWYVNFTLEVKTSSQSCWLSTPVSLDSSAGCRPPANDCGPDETLQGHSHLQVQTMISSNTLLLGLNKPHTGGVSDLTVKSMSEAYCASIQLRTDNNSNSSCLNLKMVFIGHGFTSREQESESMFSGALCKIQAKTRYRSVLDVVCLKVKDLCWLHNCFLEVDIANHLYLIWLTVFLTFGVRVYCCTNFTVTRITIN